MGIWTSKRVPNRFLQLESQSDYKIPLISTRGCHYYTMHPLAMTIGPWHHQNLPFALHEINKHLLDCIITSFSDLY